MPYALRWLDDERSVLMVSADGNVTWDEYHKINEEALKIVAALPHRVDVIFHSKVGLPSGSPLPHFREEFLKWDAAHNLGMVVVVEANRMSSFIRASVEIAVRLLGFNLPNSGAFVATLDEAIACIKSDRAEKNSAPHETPPSNKN